MSQYAVIGASCRAIRWSNLLVASLIGGHHIFETTGLSWKHIKALHGSLDSGVCLLHFSDSRKICMILTRSSSAFLMSVSNNVGDRRGDSCSSIFRQCP